MLRNNYDIVVVGGGPAGSVAAKFAAEAGLSVALLEKDRDIGYPVRCGEAVAKEGLDQFIDINPSFISSIINEFVFIAPNGNKVEIPVGNEAGYVLERRIFDYELAKNAAKAGAEILTRAYVTGLINVDNETKGIKYQFQGEEHQIRCKVVIAADGVESRVARWAGLKTSISYKEMESCASYTIANANTNPNSLYFYLGENIAPSGYLWVFSKANNAANVGIGISGDINRKYSAMKYLDKFVEAHYPKTQILTKFAGGDPSSLTLEKISAPGLLVAGDAARMVNPLNGGGIYTAMLGGMLAAQTASESIHTNNPQYLLNFDKIWSDRMGKRHERFYKIKNAVFSFSDDKYNSFADSMMKIAKEDRSFGKLFRTALFHNPSLLLDVAKLFIK